MKKLRYVVLMLIALVAVFSLVACDDSRTQAPQQLQGGLIGQTAPDLTLTDMQGQKVSLSQFRGKVVILNFWATWCPPCREEMPSMEKLHLDYQDKGLVMLAVNVEQNGKEVVADFLKKTPYSFPILLDEDQVVQNSYGVFRFPESFIIDRNGVVIERIIGARNWLSGPTFKVINFLLNG
jgi:peroxiredoxin